MEMTLTDRVLQELPACACCNRPVQGSGGIVLRDNAPWAVYAIRWVPEMVPEHGASIRLSFPATVGGGLSGARDEVCLDLLHNKDRKGLFVVDAWGESVLSGETRGMSHDDVCGSEFEDLAKQVISLVWDQDDNLGELRTLQPQADVQTSGPSPSECCIQQVKSAAIEGNSHDRDDAKHLARQNWQRFLDTFGSMDGETFQVKREFVEGEIVEPLWVLITSMEGTTLRGRVGNEPEQLKNVKQLDEVEFGSEEVLDWLVIDHGENYAGGYSLTDEDPRQRAVRILADTNNIPTSMLRRFLTGLDLSQNPGGLSLESFEEESWKVLSLNIDRSAEDFSESEMRKSFHDDFEQIVLKCPSVQVDLWHQACKQKEPLTLELTSTAAEGFASGELVRKIHEAGYHFYSQIGVARFAGMRFVYVNEDGSPVYALMARAEADPVTTGTA